MNIAPDGGRRDTNEAAHRSEPSLGSLCMDSTNLVQQIYMQIVIVIDAIRLKWVVIGASVASRGFSVHFSCLAVVMKSLGWMDAVDH